MSHYVTYLTAYKTYLFIRCTLISEGKILKKCTTIKRDKINIMNIINDNLLNLHDSLLNNDRCMKVILKSKQIGMACKLTSQILILHMTYKTLGNFKRYSSKKIAPYMASNTVHYKNENLMYSIVYLVLFLI